MNEVVPLNPKKVLSDTELEGILDEVEEEGQYNTRTLAEKMFTQMHGKNAIEEHPEAFQKLLKTAHKAAGVSIHVDDDGVVSFEGNAAGRLLFMEALGLSNVPASQAFLSDIINISSRGTSPDQDATNQTIGVIQEIEPKDGIEALLATQMAAVHRATIDVARRCSRAESLEQFKHYERALGRLGKTFAKQVEALKKHRSNGSQQINVKHQHVTVSDNGQAVIGDIKKGED
ncbi:MAG: hypothetical protein AAGF54_06035 [Pseudomonadota bacterium]